MAQIELREWTLNNILILDPHFFESLNLFINQTNLPFNNFKKFIYTMILISVFLKPKLATYWKHYPVQILRPKIPMFLVLPTASSKPIPLSTSDSVVPPTHLPPVDNYQLMLHVCPSPFFHFNHYLSPQQCYICPYPLVPFFPLLIPWHPT